MAREPRREAVAIGSAVIALNAAPGSVNPRSIPACKFALVTAPGPVVGGAV